MYVTHVSIILIFVGALIGSFFGFKAFLNLPEGQASKVVYLRNEPMWDQLMAALGIAKSPVIPNPQGGCLPCRWVIVSSATTLMWITTTVPRAPTGMPSEYHSTLSVFNLDREKVLDKRIRVNDPLSLPGHHLLPVQLRDDTGCPRQGLFEHPPQEQHRDRGETVDH